MPRRIKLMVSSRNVTSIDFGGKPVPLSDVRRSLKELVESITPFGEQLFECWINEDSPGLEGSSDAWDKCLDRVKKSDIILVLFNGSAGWAKSGSAIGICHAEMEKAMNTGAAKVFAIRLPDVPTSSSGEERARNQRFADYYEAQNVFEAKVSTGEELLEEARATIHEAIVEIVRLGGREARKGKFDVGEALDWSRLSLSQRKEAIEGVLSDYLRNLSGSEEAGEATVIRIVKKKVLVACHAVPAAMTTSVAREMVGRPFLHDHEYADMLAGQRAGPVHLVACHRNVTENQAIDLMGHPDVILVSPGFGVYVADDVRKVQVILLANCRDETSTRHALQRAIDWLGRSGEARHLARRAAARARIVKLLAKENRTDES